MNLTTCIFASLLLISITGFAQKPTSTIKSEETNYESLLSRANGYYSSKDWQNAIKYFSRALADTSTSPLMWQRLAYSNFMLSQYDPALKYYFKSLSLNPNPGLKGVINNNVIQIFQRQRKGAEAFAFLKSAADNGFNNTYLIDTMRLLDSFRKTSDFDKLMKKVTLNAFPCLSQPHRNDFDFWVGEWDVYQTGTSNLVGRSLITKDPSGCSVFEEWTSLVSPQTGRSINYYDPVKDKWEQVYVGSGGSNQLYSDGVYKESQMHFIYESVFNGAPYTGNFIFYNQGPDQVRQYQDYTTDGGKTFSPNTDLTYKRKMK